MIPYIELRDKQTRLPKSIISPIDCFFELSYYATGEFQIICPSRKDIAKDDFISLPNRPYIWIVQKIIQSFDATRGYTTTISGFQAKYILNWRVNSEPTELSTNLATAVRSIYNAHINPNGARSLDVDWKATTVVKTLRASTIFPRGNVLEFLSEFLEERECACDIEIINDRLSFYLYEGQDKSGSVIFSQTFDNLISSENELNAIDERTFCYSQKNGVVETVNLGGTGLARKEHYLESEVETTYTNQEGEQVELDLTDPAQLAIFKGFLEQAGRVSLGSRKVEEKFDGTIDTSLSQYRFGVDYGLGDKVKIKDDKIGIEKSPRVLKFTIAQSASGYSEEIEVG